MATIEWKNLNVSVDVSKPCQGRERKRLIYNANGYVRPGEILAVIGPSGAGKTTLFNCLAQRMEAYDVGGELLLNGAPYGSEELRTVAGFVWQEALYHSHLTVREALTFSARLKLPDNTTKEQREQVVNQAIDAFDLHTCADTKIGDASVKGISGGEKKRLSIAVEVMSRPKLIFLDEPTSGLDATSAVRLISILKTLALNGTTVILTLHQPRLIICDNIDKFLVLSSGQTVFFGPLDACLSHFADMGHHLPPNENPTDYLLDLINSEGVIDEADDTAKNRAILDMINQGNTSNSQSFVTNLPPSLKVPSALEVGQTRAELGASLARKFRDSPHFQEFGFLSEDFETDPPISVKGSGFPSSWLTRFLVVLHREFLQKLRNPQVFSTQLLFSIVLATVMGSFFYQVEDQDFFSAVNAISFAVMFGLFFSFHLVLVFPNEREVFLREFRQGIIGTSEYYLGLVISDIPGGMMAPLIFSSIFFWMVFPRASGTEFGIYLGFTILGALTGGAMLLAVGAMSPDSNTANSLVSVVFLWVSFLNGVFAVAPVAWQWVETINFLRFINTAVIVSHFEGLDFNCTFGVDPNCLAPNGTAVLNSFDMPLSSEVPLGLWALYTIIVFVIFHIIGLLAVSFMYNGRCTRACRRRRNAAELDQMYAEEDRYELVGSPEEDWEKGQAEVL